MLFLPKTRWLGVLEQSWASLFYYQNWLLQSEAVDYFAADSALQSPLMHLWSMSMQGQIFLLFPLLVWVVARLAKRFDVSVRKLALAVFGLLALGSFVWLLAKFVDGANLSYYFDTRSRIWEFAIGSLVAIVEPWIRVSNRISTVLGWLGVGVVVLFGLVSIGSYPGPAALAPMMGGCVYAPVCAGGYFWVVGCSSVVLASAGVCGR
jgi:peptidoglycan/LPS O-acetylase OafA/YrhL